MLSKLALALAWVGLAVVAFAEHRPDNQGLPLVRSDIPYCFTIKNPPLGKHRIDISGRAPVSEMI